LPDPEEPLGTDECILSTTTTTHSTSEGKRISRDEFFKRLKLKSKNEHNYRRLSLPRVFKEPTTAEEWQKNIGKWGSSLERDEMHELIIDLQEGQETDREVILKALRYYKLNLPLGSKSKQDAFYWQY
jgi:hypothetical protein